MRLSIRKSKNFEYFYIIKDYTIKGKRTTKIVEKLGTLEDVKLKANNKDYKDWIKNYISNLNKLDQEENRTTTLNLNPKKELPKNIQTLLNGGYLFLQNIYYNLGINTIVKDITDKHKFSFDLNSILSNLIYSRIIYPSSKLSTFELSKKFIEQPNFELQHIYRALEILSKENGFIQSEVYKNSLKISKRNTGVIYYDCTNYFFEIEGEEGIKQYGISKEHRPNPIVEMGLFLDGDGIPLAFNINKGNTNEQITLTPTEKSIIKDFNLSKIVVVTDAGLASNINRKFNNEGGRAFITVQSIKKLKNFLMNWALEPYGWKIPGIDDKTFDISNLEKSEELVKRFKDVTFYKERWIKENDLEQKLIVTYSLKYKQYQENIRTKQIERADKLIKSNPKKIGKVNQNDYKRFINQINSTKDGEVAEEVSYSINQDIINNEAKFDGFYGVCTNLEDDVKEIIKINKRRWEIEESFRIMKSEFKARPVYLKRDDRITAHFITCFLALIIFRYLEKEISLLDENKNEINTYPKIIDTLREFNFKHYIGDGYIPTYTRTDLTDQLEDKFNIKTRFEIVSEKKMKNICKQTKL